VKSERRRQVVSIGALAFGAALFAATLYYTRIDLFATGRRLGAALPLALLASGAWHLTRTLAWWWCFERRRAVPFWRLARLRIAAEAFSYLTVSGVAGEPLKVVLLGDRIPARDAAAAVALERVAFVIVTTLIVGVGAAIALATQPLSPLWIKVYRVFVIASALLAGGVILAIIRRESYLLSAVKWADRTTGSRASSSRVGRFVSGVASQMAVLVTGNAARLAVLGAAGVIAYGCMVAEAYLILRAVGLPITIGGAIAIETFSRVASFASAFIPASIGAMEASSVAAATAIGLGTAGGAPLAVARRLRGLFWAGVGLALYPRHRPPQPARGRARLSTDESSAPILLYLTSGGAAAIPPFVRIAGLPVPERVLKSAFRAGYQRVIVFADPSVAPGLRSLARDAGGRVDVVTTVAGWRQALGSLPPGVAVTAIGPATVVSPALLEEAAALMPLPGPPSTRDVPAGESWPVSGLLRLRVEDAADPAGVARELDRRIQSPAPAPSGEDVSHRRARLALRMPDASSVAAAERTMRRASYKDTDNKLARFNRRISLPISVALIRTPLTANQLSVILVAIGMYSAWLFSLGRYWPGVLAAFLSLAASVMDGCDGEIARLKYQESALGCWIETFGDYSWYVAIFIGLTIGATRRTGWPVFYWLGGVALAGLFVSFALLIYLRTRITAGRPEQLHTIAKARFKAEPTRWSKIVWRISFVATRSAMPYGIMAVALVGLLPLVVLLAAVGTNTYWVSLLLKLRDLLGTPEAETQTV
jgi:phosphatidylglycerophosphate synthase